MIDPNVDYSQWIFMSIGVPKFDQYFRNESSLDTETNAMLMQKAISEMKAKLGKCPFHTKNLAFYLISQTN